MAAPCPCKPSATQLLHLRVLDLQTGGTTASLRLGKTNPIESSLWQVPTRALRATSPHSRRLPRAFPLASPLAPPGFLCVLQIPIIIPCHRVIRSSGDSGSYGGGHLLKEWLLSHEKLQKEKLAR